MTTIELGKRNGRTNLQLAQEALRMSEYDHERLTDYMEDESAPEGLVARFSFAEDVLEDESTDGQLLADIEIDGEFYADNTDDFIGGDSWAGM